MQELTLLSKEQALYLRCIQRNQEAAQVLYAQWRSHPAGNPLADAMFTGAIAADEKVVAHFFDLRVWGGLLLAGPDSTAFALAQKMKPGASQEGEQ